MAQLREWSDEREREVAPKVRALRAVGLKGAFWDNFGCAQHVLQGELGDPGNQCEPHKLDDDTRDLLLTHTRLDAAHALGNTAVLLREVRTLKWLVVSAAIILGLMFLTRLV